MCKSTSIGGGCLDLALILGLFFIPLDAFSERICWIDWSLKAEVFSRWLSIFTNSETSKFNSKPALVSMHMILFLIAVTRPERSASNTDTKSPILSFILLHHRIEQHRDLYLAYLQCPLKLNTIQSPKVPILELRRKFVNQKTVHHRLIGINQK